MMLEYHPHGFHILAQGDTRGWSHNDYETIFERNPMYVQEYAEYADRAGIDYTVFYSKYAHHRQDAVGYEHSKEVEQLTLHDPVTMYVSSTGWRDKFPKVRTVSNGGHNASNEHA